MREDKTEGPEVSSRIERNPCAFGEFVFDPGSVSLRRGDEEVSLPPRVMDLLEYLLDRPGQVISKEDLLDAVWEGRFVGEESLTQAISVLRQALGDDPQEPVYIRTVPKRGYSFVSKVSREESASSLEGTPRSDVERAPWSLWRALIPLASLVVVALAVVWFDSGDDSKAVVSRVTRLTVSMAETGSDDIGIDPAVARGVPFAVSPDGARLVIRGTGPDGNRLFLRELDGFEMTELSATQGVRRSPFFSSDGQWVGFWRENALEKVSIRGGAPIEIGPAPMLHHAMWGSNDIIVMGAGFPGVPYSIPAGGGVATEIPVQGNSEEAWIIPQDLLPGGDSILVLVQSVKPWKFSLEVLSRSTGKRRRLAGTTATRAQYLPNGYIVYVESETLFAVPVDPSTFEPLASPMPVLSGIYGEAGGYSPWYAISDTGTLVYMRTDLIPDPELVWVDRSGAPTPIPGGQAPFAHARLSPDGQAAALVLRDGLKREIWTLDLARGAMRRVSTDGVSLFPAWGPDGSYLTYSSNRGGGEGISRRRVDGSGEEQRLLETATRPAPLDWEPGGHDLVFVENGPAWLWSDGEVSALEFEPQWISSLRFSPDGRLVAFDGREQGRYQVFVQPFPGSSQRIQVSSSARQDRGRFEGARNPRWGPDGTELLYQAEGGVYVAHVKSEPELQVDAPKLLFEGDYGLGFDVSPDGERFLMRSGSSSAAPRELQVVLNWFDELEGLVPHPQH